MTYAQPYSQEALNSQRRKADRYRQKYPERVVEAKKKWYRKNPDYHKIWNAAYYRKYPVKILLRVVKGRAKKEGVPFDLTVQDIVVPDRCPILDIPLVPFGNGMNSRGNNYSTLDRVVPSLGYVKGNVRVISFRANRLKNNATIDEIRAILAYMERG